MNTRLTAALQGPAISTQDPVQCLHVVNFRGRQLGIGSTSDKALAAAANELARDRALLARVELANGKAVAQ